MPMEEPHRFTQKDIARLAGVTQATVSLALNNHPSITAATRELVFKAAESLGYVADPYLSGLAAYRKRIRTPTYQGTLAWISNWFPGDSWKISQIFSGYFEGAKQRAMSLGYHLEEHSLRNGGMTPERLRKILLARNIRGLLLAPQQVANMRMEFDFRGFAAVTLGYTLAEPELHIVTTQQFRSMEIVFRKLIELGYRRPGLAMLLQSDLRSDRNWSAAFWSEQRTLPAKDRIPMHQPETLDVEGVRAWIERHKPDVVISITDTIYHLIRECGWRVPQDIGVALVSVPDEGAVFSGLWENPRLIGARAVEYVVDAIHRGEFGVPDVRMYILVGASWMNGRTVRRKPKGLK